MLHHLHELLTLKGTVCALVICSHRGCLENQGYPPDIPYYAPENIKNYYFNPPKIMGYQIEGQYHLFFCNTNVHQWKRKGLFFYFQLISKLTKNVG